MIERASCCAWGRQRGNRARQLTAGGSPACHARGMRIAGDGSTVVGRLVLVKEFVDGERAFVCAKPLFLRADDRVAFSPGGVTVMSASGEPSRPAGGPEWRCRIR